MAPVVNVYDLAGRPRATSSSTLKSWSDRVTGTIRWSFADCWHGTRIPAEGRPFGLHGSCEW